MANYANWGDIVNKYPHAGRGLGADEVSSVHLLYASAELDGLLGGRYTTPFSSNNITAKELTVDLAFLKLKVLKDKDAEALRKEVDARIARLMKGEEVMVLVDGTLIPGDLSTAWSSTMTYNPTFGLGDIEDFVGDSSQLVDEESARG